MDKDTLLRELNAAIRAGTLTEADIRSALPMEIGKPGVDIDDSGRKTTAVDVMFYVAGIVLFSTIMSVITQSWDTGNAAMHILLSAGFGAGLWAVAYYFISSSYQSDIRSGLTNALLLTGSLLLIAGGYITINEAMGTYGDVDFIPAALSFVVLGFAHLAFDRVIRRNLLLLLGVFLLVASFPSFMFGVVQELDPSVDVIALIMVTSAVLLGYAGRVVTARNPERGIAGFFDPLAVFLTLISMYIASFGDYGVLWLILLLGSVAAIFYVSVMQQNKKLLGNASFFMVLGIVTIAFKYFSGFGITFSLVIATMGILGSAAVASMLNKKIV